MTVSEYLNRKYTLLNTPAIIRDGKHGAALNVRVQDIELLGIKEQQQQPAASEPQQAAGVITTDLPF